MVRFSDMLGGSGEPDDARAAKSVYDALSDDRDADNEADDADADDEPEAEQDVDQPGAETETPPASERPPMPTFESPEDVLDRLTRYATSARAAEGSAPPDEDVPDDDALPPVGDDFLPRAKEIERKPGRNRKRRP